MVGVKSSKGCATCLRRSVKCDEQRPSCYQCRRGGRKCPGYERSMTFVDEGAKLRKRRAAPKAARYPSSLGRPSPEIKPENSPKYVALLPISVQSPRAEQDQLVACFVSAMFPLGVASLQTSLFGTWLWHIPPRLGLNAALDYSAMAVALGYFGRTTVNSAALVGAESAYMAALQSLAAMLGMREKQFEPEVLCATILLGHYESFGGTKQAWIRHAGGAARLMRLRGAQRSYESAFEYSMFLACRGTIISEALFAKEVCFLAEESWQAIPDGLIEFPLLPKDARSYHVIFCHYAAIPGLLKQFRQLASKEAYVDVEVLLETAVNLCEDLRRWYDEYTSSDDGMRLPALYKRKSKAEDVFPSEDVYMYYDTISACNITAYYAYRILVQQEMDALIPGTYTAENIRLAECICKSVDYLSNVGYCGTQTMRLTLPLTQRVLPAKYQAWVTAKITQLSQSMDEASLIQALHS